MGRCLAATAMLALASCAQPQPFGVHGRVCFAVELGQRSRSVCRPARDDCERARDEVVRDPYSLDPGLRGSDVWLRVGACGTGGATPLFVMASRAGVDDARIDVRSTLEDGLAVFVDGRAIGTAPLVAAIGSYPGPHEIRLEAAGYSGLRLTHELPPGTVLRIEVGERMAAVLSECRLRAPLMPGFDALCAERPTPIRNR